MRGTIRTAAALSCILLVVGIFHNDTMIYCEAKTGDAEKEVVDFVTAYHEAHSPEGIETLADYVSQPDDADFQMSLITLQTAFECGMTGLENISVTAYPMSDGEHWIASVESEMAVQGLAVTLPGLKAVLVGRNADGELRIMSENDESDGNDTDAFLMEIREICLSDEILDRNTEVVTKYNEIIADYPEVKEWVLETTEETDRAKAEAFGQPSQNASGRKDAGGVRADKKESRFVVKKGDCLWSIAEEQLEDGMLWRGIYEANKEIIGENPDLIYVGIELELE